MKRRILAIAFLFLIPLTLCAQSARVIVVDTSGSMATDNRLETAKTEILALAKQIPPAKSNPIILVSFNHAAKGAIFTDLPALQAHLNGLRPDGGTNISSGLVLGLEKLKALGRTDQVVFLLYTDGEDNAGFAAAFAAAEEQLNAMFAARNKQGLPSLLFVKRWENANASLLAKIAKSGHAQVIDGKDLKLVPVTLTPAVTIHKVSWDQGSPRTLVVEGEAKLGLAGMPFDPSLPSALLRCTTPGANAKPVTLRAGDPKPASFQLRAQVSPEALAHGKAVLRFELGSIGTFSPKGGIVLPQMSQQSLDIAVDLPLLELSYSFTAELIAKDAATWADPLTSKPLQTYTFTCSLKAEPDLPWPAPITVRLSSETGRILGKETLEFNSTGTKTLQVAIEGEPVGANDTKFTITVRAIAEAANGITIKPLLIKLTNTHPVPAKVNTHITTQVLNLVAPRWTDLGQGVAGFDAEVSFQVNGPIPANTRIVLRCPPAVRSIQVEPSLLHTGHQIIRFTIQAQVAAAPTITPLDLRIEPPPPSGAVSFVPSAPIRLEAAGPPPVQMMLVNPDGASPSVRVRDRSLPVLLTGVPVLAGQAEGQLSKDITGRIRTGSLFGMHDPGPVPVYQALNLPLLLPSDVSFFFDTILEEEIEIVPSAVSPALIGARQRCVVTIEAPFKRWCFYGAIVVALLVIGWVLAQVLLRNDSGDDGASDPTQVDLAS